MGCGLASNPEPPTLWLPAPVKDLTAVRVGNQVHFHWTMPRATTDKVPLKGAQRAHFCRENAGAASSPAACVSAGDGQFAPGKPADFTAAMPAEAIAGVPRAVSYFVELENHAGKTAGPSNAALVAAGPAPSELTGLHLSAQPAGVVLGWVAAPPRAGMVLRIHRTLIQPPATQKNGPAKAPAANGVAPPQQQTLEVDLSQSDRGQALDHDVPLDHVWKYQVERVVRVEIDHHALEIAGEPSDAMTIDAKDSFPPAVPAGLEAVVDEQAHAIDLSWVPDTDADLAGYNVYRRDVASTSGPERISGSKAIVPPSFSDPNPRAGHRYAYSVSAIDQDGNESARSGEIEEQLPQ
jgi:hypothetical protein